MVSLVWENWPNLSSWILSLTTFFPCFSYFLFFLLSRCFLSAALKGSFPIYGQYGRCDNSFDRQQFCLFLHYCYIWYVFWIKAWSHLCFWWCYSHVPSAKEAIWRTAMLGAGLNYIFRRWRQWAEELVFTFFGLTFSLTFDQPKSLTFDQPKIFDPRPKAKGFVPKANLLCYVTMSYSCLYIQNFRPESVCGEIGCLAEVCALWVLLYFLKCCLMF